MLGLGSTLAFGLLDGSAIKLPLMSGPQAVTASATLASAAPMRRFTQLSVAPREHPAESLTLQRGDWLSLLPSALIKHERKVPHPKAVVSSTCRCLPLPKQEFYLSSIGRDVIRIGPLGPSS